MSALTRIAITASPILLASCNAVFGLGEGQLADGGNGTGGAGTGGQGTGGIAPSGGMGGDGGALETGGGTSTTTSGGGEGGSGGEGGGCLLEVGLENGDFGLWGASEPEEWLEYDNNAMVALSTVSGLSDGVSIGLTDVGAGAYGGIYQSVSFIDWDQCVRVSGDAKKSSNPGRFRALVAFDSDEVELTLPDESDFETFSYTCQPTQAVTTFTFKLEVDQVPAGGTVTMQSHGVAFDHVCCDGVAPPCGG